MCYLDYFCQFFFLLNIVNQIKSEAYWIGLNDVEHPGKLVWLENNKEFDFKYVSFGQNHVNTKMVNIRLHLAADRHNIYFKISGF